VTRRRGSDEAASARSSPRPAQDGGSDRASPAFGFILAAALMIAVSWIFRRSTPRRVDRWFRSLQFVSAAAYSLGHGGNDAQKTMGIIWMLLIAAGYAAHADPLPFWVVIACQAAWARHAVRRLADRQTMVCASSCVPNGSAHHGGAVHSSSRQARVRCRRHTITGSIVGVGSVETLGSALGSQAVSWAWIFTIPCSAFLPVAWWFADRYL
jgi:PiT family inorganic phosphate transporter